MTGTSNTAEEWRPIAGFHGYEVSSLGRVRSWKRGPKPILLAQSVSCKSGHLKVFLFTPERDSTSRPTRRIRRVHRLVTEAFIGPLPTGMETRHLDGDPTNNALTNLRYGTHSENQLDAVAHGTHAMATRTHCPQGHPYDAENTYACKRGARHCKECSRQRNRLRRAKAKSRTQSTAAA